MRNELLEQMVVDGFYQLDPQGGNILVEVGGQNARVHFIDLGAVGRLNFINVWRLKKIKSFIEHGNAEALVKVVSPVRSLFKGIDRQVIKEVDAVL